MSEFVNKVYDNYLNKDFSFGQDNLNPVREISLTSQEDDTVGQLLAGIREKVDEISDRYKDEPEPVYGMTNTGSGYTGDPTCLTRAKNRAGGALILIPSFENEEDALMSEVEQLMLKVGGIAGLENLDGLNGVSEIDCNGSLDLISNKNIDTSDDKLDNDLFYSLDGDDEADGDLDDDGLDSENNNGGSDSAFENGSGALNNKLVPNTSSAKVDTAGLDPSESDTRAQDKFNDAITKIGDNNKITQDNIKECAKADLTILKIIANILKVIGTIKKILNPTLNIVVELCEIITLACQVWHNPPALAEIIQKVVNKIIAILCMLISMILQMLWDLLGLDCITEEAMDLLDQIREALAGINSIFAEIDATALSFSMDIKSAIDAVRTAEDAVNEAVKNIPTFKDIKNAFAEAGTEFVDDWSKNWKKYTKDAGADVLEQSGLAKKVSDAIVAVEEIGSQWRNIQTSAASMAGANSGIQRLMSSFDDVRSL